MKARLVCGNHEEKALRWLRHESKKLTDPKYKNPMHAPPPERQAQWRALTEAQVDYLKNAPHMLALPLDPALRADGGDSSGGWLAVHAGFEPGCPLEKQKADVVTRVRYVNDKGEMIGYKKNSLDQPEGTVYWTEKWRGPQSVVYGHAVHSVVDPRHDVYSTEDRVVHMFGIDTGCCFGGRLTAMILTSWPFMPTFVQVQAKRQYYPWPKGLMGVEGV